MIAWARRVLARYPLLGVILVVLVYLAVGYFDVKR